MKRRGIFARTLPNITIRVSGKLFRGHLDYLDQLVQFAAEKELWPLLSLSQLDELDGDALAYLIDGEDRRFGLVACPDFVRQQIERERHREAA